MQVNTRFSVGDHVRVVNDGGFVGTITRIFVDVYEHEQRTGYEVTLPEEKRGKGRYYTETWAYREDWLEAV